MLIVKRIAASFILPPGLLIVFSAAFGTILVLKRYKKIGAANIFFGITLWILSITPMSHFLLSRLESDFYQHADAQGDIIILLGGAVFEKVSDVTGWGFPDGDMLGRIVTAVRLQKKLNVPVIISFGDTNPDTEGGAPVVKRLMMDLGVAEDSIILEKNSRNTYENIKFSMEICRKLGFSRPILVTSAYHLKRAHWISTHLGLDAVPFPAYFVTHDNSENTWYGLLPSAQNSARIATALHEYLGLWYYRLFYA